MTAVDRAFMCVVRVGTDLGGVRVYGVKSPVEWMRYS